MRPGVGLHAATLTIILLLAGAPTAAARDDPGVCVEVAGAVRAPSRCDPSGLVSVSWTVTEGGAEGTVRFSAAPLYRQLSVRSLDVEVLDGPPALVSQVARLLGGAPAPASVEVLVLDGLRADPDDAKVAVELRFRMAWSAGCASARGGVVALVDGAQVDAAVEPSFADLCGLLVSARSQADPAVAVGLARVLVESAQAIPGLAIEPVLVALDALARARAPEPVLVVDGGADAQAAPAKGEADVDARVDAEATLDAAPAEPEPDAPAARARAKEARLDAARVPAPPARATSTLPPAEPSSRAPVPAEPSMVPPGRAAPSSSLRALGSASATEAPVQAATLLAGAAVLLAALFALYQRHTRHASLAHPARAALHVALSRRSGGASVAQLAVDAGIPRKTAEYHLLYLARLGLVRSSDPADGPRLFHLHAREAGPSLQEALVQRIRERPGVSTGELAALLGVSRARVDWRVKGLVLDGVVRSARVDGERRLFPA